MLRLSFIAFMLSADSSTTREFAPFRPVFSRQYSLPTPTVLDFMFSNYAAVAAATTPSTSYTVMIVSDDRCAPQAVSYKQRQEAGQAALFL